MHVPQTYFQSQSEPETLFTFSPSIKTCLQRDLNWHFPPAASKLSKSKCDKCRAERQWDKLQLPWQLSACVPPSATPQLYWLAVGDTISSIGQRPPFAPVSGSTCVLEINYPACVDTMGRWNKIERRKVESKSQTQQQVCAIVMEKATNMIQVNTFSKASAFLCSFLYLYVCPTFCQNFEQRALHLSACTQPHAQVHLHSREV